ncbi:adenylate/guanylate cyclase domain-containing protein [Marinospirillum perlucidum]|uniref:adenylate/guanylate cyclase domain-containing protein n=1 Tax=Marinospirillum perlucidum TaxID=1982602 RepID=UPI000DF38AAD|nr:adenylate/guanylate cyclase domain-containing protein [Marinospirillum perlucidum]
MQAGFKLLRDQWQLWALLSGLLLALMLLSLKPPVMVQALSSALSDSYYDWNPRSYPDDLVFVEVENTSVQQFGRWPWPRSLVAAGLERMHQARVIGVDIAFAEPTRPQEDQALAASLYQLPVIGGSFLNGPQAQALDEAAYGRVLDSALMQAQGARLLESRELELPIPLIRDAYPALSALNIQPDADQRFRHYPLAFWVRDAAFPNLGVQMWRLAQMQDLVLTQDQALLGERSLPVDELNRVKLNFYSGSDYPRITFAELMADDWNPERLQGKWVILGISEAGITDLRSTPLGQLAGPLVHLTFLGNLMDSSLLQDLQGGHLLGVLLLCLLGLLGLLQLHQTWLRFAGYLILLLGVYAGGVVLYVQADLWLEVFYPLLFLVLGIIGGELWLFLINKAKADHLRQAFGSYVAPALVEKIVGQERELKLGGQRQQMTLLFSDLRNFTPTTEALETEELVRHLNRYFDAMINALQAYRGTLDKLIGDAVMGLFNAPLADEDHSYHACLAAAAMQWALEDFNTDFPEGDVRRLAMGIGINTGEGVVGNIGGRQRFNYTAIGDVVNVAARLESATKEVNQAWKAAIAEGETKPCASVDILVGEGVYEAVKGRLPLYPVGELSLKGKSSGLAAWALDWRALEPDWLKQQAEQLLQG